MCQCALCFVLCALLTSSGSGYIITIITLRNAPYFRIVYAIDLYRPTCQTHRHPMLIVNDGSSLGPVGVDADSLESDTGDVDVWAIPVAIGNTATSGFKQPLVPRIKDRP